MRGSTLALAIIAVPFSSAISLGPRSANPRAVGLPIARNTISNPVTRDRARLRKRQNTVSETLTNEETLYFANLTLGTPEQSIAVSIDTGSSDLWVNTPTSSICTSQPGCVGGTYSRGSSSTAKIVNNDFNISYVDGSGASGNYVSDTLHFAGLTLDSFQFGVGSTSDSEIGVLGIGYADAEVQVNRAGDQAYPNLPVALVNAGHINSAAYSLWLNDLDASTGTILFGGVNTAKYTGDLVTVPVLREYSEYISLTVALSGVQFNGQTISSSSLPSAVVLDSGTSLIYLPDDIVQSIYNQVDVVYEASAGTAYGYCEDASQDKSISFTFSGKTISVPFNELYIQAGASSNGQPLTFKNGKQACIFGISPTGGSTPLLGDVFLRSAYVVYDLANNEISIAQTVFNSTSDDVREITTGSNAVPGASAAASPVTSVVNQATGGGHIIGVTQTGSLGSEPTGAATHARPDVLGSLAGGIAALGLMLVL